MMSFLPVFTVEIWRYYTVFGGPNNRLTGNGKNRVGNTNWYCVNWLDEQGIVTLYYNNTALCTVFNQYMISTTNEPSRAIICDIGS
jgi:hypothetical protein